MKILVSGANGFVGKPLCEALIKRGWMVRGAVRSQGFDNLSIEFVKINDINAQTDWSEALRDIDVVIHLAARVHNREEMSADPLMEFQKVNVEGTKQLAMQATKAGVKRFVYVSSIGVMGPQGKLPFTEEDKPNPQNYYSISKWEAEKCLSEIAKKYGLEVVIIRPPLIYGPNAPGNFFKMTQLIKKKIPLPLASIKNLRSLIYIDNFIDALVLCVNHPKAAGKTFLISDGDDVSTPQLFIEVAKAMGAKINLLPCPIFLLKVLALFTGKRLVLSKLLDYLQIDNSKIKHDLGWKPKVCMGVGLKRTFEKHGL
jgi:nucleoside-diphosphate-sugar epimerase